MSKIIRVLIVDDSAYVRKVVRQMLSRSPLIEVVGTAHDGKEALIQVEQLKPDVVTLDLNMPKLDGLGFLRQQMARHPVPVVLLSIASQSGELVIQALEAGAFDIVKKPTALANEKVLEIADDLIAKVKAAATAKVHQTIEPTVVNKSVVARAQTAKKDVLVIGVSTGGPQALRYLIPLLPKEFPIPILVVLHMPKGYTEPYARSLSTVSQLEVREARHGEEVRPGLVLIAPAGYHLNVGRGENNKVFTRLTTLPSDTLHRPSVDVLFKSVATVYGDKVLAVVLTGMGSDGTIGASWIKAQGGLVLTEAEESCVVYGMPRAVVEAGLSDAIFPLPGMARAIFETL